MLKADCSESSARAEIFHRPHVEKLYGSFAEAFDHVAADIAEALAERFEIEHVHKGGAVFDKDRLDFLNGVYIRSMTDEQLAMRLRAFVPEALDDRGLVAVIPLIKERMVRLADARELVAFLIETDAEVALLYGPDELVPPKADAAGTAAAVTRAREELAAVAPDDFAAGELEARCRAAAEAFGWKAGDFFRPMRVAITGRTVSPPLFGSMELLGRERCLARLDAALTKLAAVAAA